MHLTPKDTEKLLLHYAGEVAIKRKDRGLKLNYVEAIAYISYFIMERARDGARVAEVVQEASSYLKASDCMDGVADMVDNVQVEATFSDGTKLVSVHKPIN